MTKGIAGRVGAPHLVLLGALAIVATLTALGVWDPHRTESAWSEIGVPSLERTFGDLRVVLGALDCTRAGLDVYVADPCETSPLNHPPIWLLLARTGLGLRETNAIGVSMAVLFVAGLAQLFRRVPLHWAWLVLPAAFSPMSLLLVERGNTDLIIWLLLLLATLLLTGNGRRRAIAGAVTLSLATALKLFPVFFAFTNALKIGKGAAARHLALATALLAVVAEAPWFSRIASNTWYGFYLSYGYKVVFYWALDPGRIQMGMSAAALLVATLVAWRLSKSRVQWPAISDDRESILYLAGAATYVGTFFLGSNWGYRTVFLLFCIPLLCSESDHTKSSTRWPRTSLVVAFLILGLMWTLGQTLGALVVSQMFAWTLFVVLAAHLLAVLHWRETLQSMAGYLMRARG